MRFAVGNKRVRVLRSQAGGYTIRVTDAGGTLVLWCWLPTVKNVSAAAREAREEIARYEQRQ
jgi:hypothetical protein